MDAAFYRDVLYPLQDRVLNVIQSADTEFYLSGGTAASRGYLDHRFSDDLDFFVNDDDRFSLWADRVVALLSENGDWALQVNVREDRFVRLEIATKGTSLKIELINDVPSRVGEITAHPLLGRLDTAENILAIKLTALVSRSEPKDIADVWGFSLWMNLTPESAISDAQSKAAGIFPADVARVLLSAAESDWSLVRWTTPPPLNQYLSDLRTLGEGLLLGPVR